MTSHISTLPNRPLPVPRLYLKVLPTGLLAGWADFLFFGHDAGVSFALFIATLAAASVLVERHRMDRRHLASATLVLALALLPALEDLAALSAMVAVAGLLGFTMIAHGRLPGDGLANVIQALRICLIVPFRLLMDVLSSTRLSRRKQVSKDRSSGFYAWIVPVSFTLAFLFLFSLANPVIAVGLAKIDLTAIFNATNAERSLFWLAVIAACWPFIRFRLRRRDQALGASETPAMQEIDGRLFGEPAVFRALALFNLLFAVQIALDVAFLLGGADLPDGMTYASYAHRGAYTLIVTALLAAAFVLYATRPGSHSGASPRVLRLVLAWTVQNVVLVVFSIQRLMLYIDVYALTYWRISALIWMVLVLIGLSLIFVKLSRGNGNRWLINANLISLGLVLYMTSLANLPGIIANFNADAALKAPQTRLDISYVEQLGPASIPAIDRLLASQAKLHLIFRSFKYTASHDGTQATALLRTIRNRLTIRHSASSGWRQWSYRRHRLQTYLDTTSYTRVPNEPDRHTP